MASTRRRPRVPPTPGISPGAVEERTEGRWLYLDNAKVLLIAVIIAIHAVLGYVGFDQLWSYADVQGVTLAPLTELILFGLIGPFGIFMIAFLFLVAGLFAAPAVRRKGPARFALDRVKRLGIPFAAFTLILWPSLMYALYHPLGAAPGSYREEFLDENGNLDTGPLWFVGVLLIFSLGYAGWARLHPPAVKESRPHVSIGWLLLVVAIVTVTTFPVRLEFPFGSESGFTDLNLWEWPECIALFVLGVGASDAGWLRSVPRTLRSQAGAATGLGLTAAAALGVSAALQGVLADALGGWHWSALGFAAIESVLTVFGSVWLLGIAQRHLGRRLPLGAALTRSAYGAFLLQGIPLIVLAVAMRPIPVPAEAKAFVVATGAVVGSYAASWLLISRVRWLASIL